MERARLFAEVADLVESDRSRFYEDHEVQPQLRAEIESLLRFDSADDDTQPACIAAIAGQAFWEGSETGLRCGPYLLDRELGRGGMGAVYIAHRVDGELTQTVAVKLLSTAGPPSGFTERFLQERQILASLNHPGLTHLINAGHTADGRPYLVMEYVDGEPIDAYCRNLNPRAVVELLLKVCEALAYAHRNLIIHRDLKPSNILVEPGGNPKVLDFGIARILDPGSDGALTVDRFLTPDFASPEQLAGAICTTATDIYSLGAVLHFLITGRSPRAAGSPSARLSTTVPRDLDFIVRKAIRPEPGERYASMTAFSDDLRAFLELRPVSARSGNAWYRTRRFARRHWIPASALALSLAGLSIGIYTAEQQRALAQKRFHDLRQLANRVLGFDEEIQGLPGSTKARQHVVSAGMEYLDGLAPQAHNDPSLTLEVAAGYLQLGQVLGVPTRQNLGQAADAEVTLVKAQKAAEEVLKNPAHRVDALTLESEILMDRMILADSAHRDADAEALNRQCVRTLDQIDLAGGASPKQRHDISSFYYNASLSFLNRHELDDALRYARKVVTIAGANSDQRNLAVSLSLVANILRQSGDLDGALTAVRESRSVAEKFSFADETDRALTLYTILWRQGQILGSDEGVSLGRADEALEPLRRAFELMNGMAAKDPDDQTSRDRVATAAWQLGDVLRHRNPRQALSVFDAAITRQREVKNNSQARREEALLMARSSYALRDLHREAEARERVTQALEILRASGEYPAPTVQPGGVTETAIRALADAQTAEGMPKEAASTYRDLLDREMGSHPHPESSLAQATSVSLIYMGLERACTSAGENALAGEARDLRRALWRSWDRRLPSNPYVRRQLQAVTP